MTKEVRKEEREVVREVTEARRVVRGGTKERGEKRERTRVVGGGSGTEPGGARVGADARGDGGEAEDVPYHPLHPPPHCHRH